jgi:hypothetical protein
MQKLPTRRWMPMIAFGALALLSTDFMRLPLGGESEARGQVSGQDWFERCDPAADQANCVACADTGNVYFCMVGFVPQGYGPGTCITGDPGWCYWQTQQCGSARDSHDVNNSLGQCTTQNINICKTVPL